MERSAPQTFWQAYLQAYGLRTSAVRGDNTTCLTSRDDLEMMFSADCYLTPRELFTILSGLCLGLLWSFGYLLYTAPRVCFPNAEDTRVWIKISLLTHFLSDIMSCVGAILAMQFLSQIAFGVTVVVGNWVVTMVMYCRHLRRQVDKVDSNSSHRLQVPCCCHSGWTFSFSLTSRALCTLLFLSIFSLGSHGDPGSQTSAATKIATVVTADEEILDLTGRVLGACACLLSWVASASDAWTTHKYGGYCAREVVGDVLMGVTNAGYLLMTLWQPSFSPDVARYTSPWIIPRAGLILFNVGILFLLFLGRRRQSYHKLTEDGDCLSLLSSTSTGSGVEAAESNALWEEAFTDHAKPAAVTSSVQGQPNVHQPTGRWQQQSARACHQACHRAQQSTDTSCSRTGEEDTELEMDLNQHIVFENRTRHDTALRNLSALTPETRQDRVIQWVRKSLSEEQDTYMDLCNGDQRKHSSSFSQSKSEQALQARPSARKNSSTF